MASSGCEKCSKDIERLLNEIKEKDKKIEQLREENKYIQEDRRILTNLVSSLDLKDSTYTKFVISIVLSLFSNVLDWIDKSFYDIGRYLGTKIKGYYHIERESRRKLYIVIHSDGKSTKRIDSKELITYISEAYNSVIDSFLIEQSFEDVLNSHNNLNTKHVKEVLKYIKDPTLEETQEIMRGIVSL
jgi:hypothetical protein